MHVTQQGRVSRTHQPTNQPLRRCAVLWGCALCCPQVVASEGVGALAIGLAPTLWRNCVWNSLYYVRLP